MAPASSGCHQASAHGPVSRKNQASIRNTASDSVRPEVVKIRSWLLKTYNKVAARATGVLNQRRPSRNTRQAPAPKQAPPARAETSSLKPKTF